MGFDFTLNSFNDLQNSFFEIGFANWAGRGSEMEKIFSVLHAYVMPTRAFYGVNYHLSTNWALVIACHGLSVNNGGFFIHNRFTQLFSLHFEAQIFDKILIEMLLLQVRLCWIF
jgi:hypothetical protein